MHPNSIITPQRHHYTINHNRTAIAEKLFMVKLAVARYTINHNRTAIAERKLMAKLAAAHYTISQNCTPIAATLPMATRAGYAGLRKTCL